MPCELDVIQYKTGFLKQISRHSPQNSIWACKPHRFINVLQRPEYLQSNYNIEYLPGLKNSIQTCKTHESICPNVLQRPEQFRKPDKIVKHVLSRRTYIEYHRWLSQSTPDSAVQQSQHPLHNKTRTPRMSHDVPMNYTTQPLLLLSGQV